MPDGWVSTRFGARLTGDEALPELVQLALRRNPRRAQLLVSTVLGKHLPADPARIEAAGAHLGQRVAQTLGGRSALVVGFAETATGLGHLVAETLAAPYLHSTRRVVAGATAHAAFAEEHSHATGHRLLPEDRAFLDAGDVLVLVDDELSTGRTALNTIAALHSRAARSVYVLAALVDLRSVADRAECAAVAARLGVRIEVVALATGTLELPADFADSTRRYVASSAPPDTLPDTPVGAPDRAELTRYADLWPATVRESGRHGFTARDAAAARDAARTVADKLAPGLDGGDVLVLGTEELMYAPLLIAAALSTGRRVLTSSTTRSPIHVQDTAGYPIRSALTFPSSDPAADDPGPRYAYNVARRWSDVVLVVDSDADTAALHAGLVEQLRPWCRHVHLVVLPCHHPLPPPLRSPDFGSYPADEVAWLLTDLSAVALEAPTEEREEAIQSGGAHYAESLPFEYQPDAAYQRLFAAALDAGAARVAHAVGVVTELVLAERGPRPVLVSLARAGTPIGVLMRRWAAFVHGLDLPHYAISIVRGRGIDEAALRYLAVHHDPADVVFVDGWTGKGAIARELATAVASANAALGTRFGADLAVLADPGACVRTYGTREDFLIPSACLNSTVSGLVSRTVRNPRVLTSGQYDGAKFYADAAPADVSAHFVDTVAGRFAEVAAAVDRDWPAMQAADRQPTWAGWADVERLAAHYGIDDVTLVKPGVGETTRVLLRRVPWAVLVRDQSADDLAHVLLLASQRGVAVHEVPDLTYACVGLIHPRYTRGATGSTGTLAR